MTSSQTWSMFVLSYTSTTSSFILITLTNTRLTSVKFSVGSVKMACMRAPTNVLSTKTLGYILLPTGLTMDPTKVQTIQDWPEPRKIKEIQSFLGFANFYRRFIHAY